MLQTSELDGAQDQGLAIMFGPQVPGFPSAATPAAAGIAITGLTYENLALHIHRLCGTQKLEGFKPETGIGAGASDIGPVGAVFSTPKCEDDRLCYCTNTLGLT